MLWWRQDTKQTTSISSPCSLCSLPHDLDECTLNKSVEERSISLKKKKLCYGYYAAISSTHTVRTCLFRRIQQWTSILPAWNTYIRSKRITSLKLTLWRKKSSRWKTMQLDWKTQSAGVLFQWKFVKIAPKKYFHNYVMLDNCSQGAFVTEDLLEKLEVLATRITIKTCQENSQSVQPQWLDWR